jgi:hypothetical protein
LIFKLTTDGSAGVDAVCAVCARPLPSVVAPSVEGESGAVVPRDLPSGDGERAVAAVSGDAGLDARTDPRDDARMLLRDALREAL